MLRNDTAVPALVPEYCTILCQCFTPDGQHLVTGDDAGTIKIYSCKDIKNADEPSVNPKYLIVSKSSIVCMKSTKEFLVIGSIGFICGYKWDHLLMRYNARLKPNWKYSVTEFSFANPCAVVNAIAVDNTRSTSGEVYLGCDDSNVHVVDIETGKLKGSLSKHSDFIHSVSIQEESDSLVSGGEDGVVCVWDLRNSGRTPQETNKSLSHEFKPFEHDKLNRPTLGKWVGDAVMDGEWVICGGGPLPGAFHLRTLTPRDTPLLSGQDHPHFGIHCITLTPKTLQSVDLDQKSSYRVILGGGHQDESTTPPPNKLYEVNLEGEMLAEITTASSQIYSLVHSPSEVLLSAAGSSSKLDICKQTLQYRSHTIIVK